MTPMPQPPSIQSIIDASQSMAGGLLPILVVALITMIAGNVVHRFREIDRAERETIEKIKNYAEKNAWTMLEEYHDKHKNEDNKSEADETPIYMTIGDDGELVERNDNGNS